MREKRTFFVVLLAVLGVVTTSICLDPGDEANAALLAYRQQRVQDSNGLPRVETVIASGARVTAGAAEEVRSTTEVVERIEAGLPLLQDARIDGWVRDLRDDGIAGNALIALRCLVALPAGAIPQLQSVLASRDPQLRHFAAGVLRTRCAMQKDRVTDGLLRVSVEALRSDLGPVANAAFSTRIGPLLQRTTMFLAEHTAFLAEHTAAAHDLLVPQLTSINKQQRFLSAYLLARSELREHSRWQANRIAYELVDHLADNDVEGDAMMAANGLYRLGDEALPALSGSRRYLDEQGRKLVDLILLDLEQPPRTKRDLYRRGSMVRISRIYHDPVVEYDLSRSRVPGFGRR